MKDKNQKTSMKEEKSKINCTDRHCPVHGEISVRGRVFEGTITKKFKKRIVLEFERPVYIVKYERYAKAKTKLQAHLPDCMAEEIHIGDYVQVGECRPISKTKHFVLLKKIRSREGKK